MDSDIIPPQAPAQERGDENWEDPRRPHIKLQEVVGSIVPILKNAPAHKLNHTSLTRF